jgi:DNA-binding NarL/FixJ family response regulator
VLFGDTASVVKSHSLVARAGEDMAIRLIVVDRSPITLIGMRTFIQGTDIQIVAELDSCDDVCARTLELRPDVVVLSFCMSAQESVEQTRRIRETAPQTHVILVTDSDFPVFLARAREAGANEVIIGNLSRQRFLDAVTRAATGEPHWSIHNTRRLAAVTGSAYDNASLDVPLTRREMEVLLGVTGGKTNRQIASALGISYETVKEHVQNLLRKIAVEDRTQAAIWAVRRGLT